MRVSRWSVVGFLFIMYTLVPGCGALPQSREMGEMALVRTLGVDAVQDGAIQVTASTGIQTQGLQQVEEPVGYDQAVGATMAGACDSLLSSGEELLFYGYVDQLLVGQSQGVAGLSAVLEYFAHSDDLALGTHSWLILGQASQVMAVEGGVETRLSALTTQSSQGGGGLTVTAGEALTALLEEGACYLPALSDGDGVLSPVGYGIFVDDCLAGVLVDDSARGLERLESHWTGVTELWLEDRAVAVTAVGCTTTIAPIWQGDALVGAAVTCQLEGTVPQGGTALGETERELLCAILETQTAAEVAAALTQLQQWDGDCISLGRQLGLAAPWLWEEIAQWDGVFATLDVTIEVTATLAEE